MPDVSGSEEAFRLLEATPVHDLSTRLCGVSVSSGDVRHALDTERVRHLLIPVESDVAVEDRQSRGVTVCTRTLIEPDGDEERRFIDVRCEEKSLKDLFSVVCDEVLAHLVDTPDAASTAVITVMSRWRELLGPARSTLLGEGQIKGLIGELHFVEEIAQSDPGSALMVWTGPDLARHDFTGNRLDVEVKASSVADGMTVHINGLRQLEGPAEGGDLYLLVERMEAVTVGGDSIPSLVTRLIDLGVDRHSLLQALSSIGVNPADFPAYEKVRYATLESRAYLVDDAFPRLIRSSVASPEHLDRYSRVEYWLDLAGQPPVPLPEAQRSRLAADLLASLKEVT